MNETGPSARIRVAALALVALVLLVHAASYLPFLADDALISLRYSQRFLEGKGLTWTDGETVEGYSNLLWILLTSALGRAGVDLILAARLLGVLLTILILGVLARAQGDLWKRDLWLALVPSLLLALTGALAVWAIGGLEQPLQGALLAWALVWLYPVSITLFVTIALRSLNFAWQGRHDWKDRSMPRPVIRL